jgi:LysM repeat protein
MVFLVAFLAIILVILGVTIRNNVRSMQNAGATLPPTATATPLVVEAQAIDEESAAQDSPVATTVAIPSISMSLSGPDSVSSGNIRMFELILRHSAPIGVLALEIRVPTVHLQVAQDAYPEQSGLQVFNELGEGRVEINEVSPDGLLRYRIVDIGASSDENRTLLAIPLEGILEGFGELTIQSAEYLSPDGRWGDIAIEPGTLMIYVEEGGGAPTSTPTATPPPQPTPVGDLPTPTPLPGATPTPPCGAPTLPPLSEVVDTPITPQPGSIYYRIQPGQTLYRLSQSFEVTVEEIMAANDLTDVQAVPAGALLRIPTYPPEGQAAYLVSSKETLYSIAKAFGCTVEELGMLNAIGPTQYSALEVGDYLVLLP